MAIGPDEEIDTFNLIHNTPFYSIQARNEIFPTCDTITGVLKVKYEQHTNHSFFNFARGLVMKLQYRINKSSQKTSRKKYKGGAYIDHLQIPCFTKKLRTTCITVLL